MTSLCIRNSDLECKKWFEQCTIVHVVPMYIKFYLYQITKLSFKGMKYVFSVYFEIKPVIDA